jgi:MraZ protein
MDLQSHDDRPPILTTLIDQPALGLYAHQHWLEVEERLSKMSQAQPEVASVRRMLVSSAEECPIDAQGRILVPPHLREHAGLEREVTLAGVGPRIEIWSKTRFEDEMKRTRERAHEIASIAAQAGL